MNRCLSGALKKGLKRGHRLLSGSAEKSKGPPWKVLFFGSDEFSLYSLKALNQEAENLLKTLEVVTCSQKNQIFKYCRDQHLPVHKWPPDLSGQSFDLGIVVSFGYLIPEALINQFPRGMINVHGSLLPRWRGASPIVYALANGDKETGVTIMKVRPRKFDVGEIICQEVVPIGAGMEMPQLHSILGQLGAKLLVQTIWNLQPALEAARPQPEDGASYAPKITQGFAQVQWSCSTAKEIERLYRALKSVFPLKTTWYGTPVKLSDIAMFQASGTTKKPGHVYYSKPHKALIVECAGSTWISVKEVGVQGKKTMKAADFYNGFISKLPDQSLACFQ
ncbi:methionyl-tRNA formyltransferase, mitochondrial [Dendroctonus ponderosae]